MIATTETAVQPGGNTQSTSPHQVKFGYILETGTQRRPRSTGTPATADKVTIWLVVSRCSMVKSYLKTFPRVEPPIFEHLKRRCGFSTFGDSDCSRLSFDNATTIEFYKIGQVKGKNATGTTTKLIAEIDEANP